MALHYNIIFLGHVGIVVKISKKFHSSLNHYIRHTIIRVLFRSNKKYHHQFPALNPGLFLDSLIQICFSTHLSITNLVFSIFFKFHSDYLSIQFI